jgi:hypothetical protein
MVDADPDSLERGKARAMALDAEARRAFEVGDYPRSRQLFEQALAVCQSIGWKEEIIYGLLHVTQAMSFEPDYDDRNLVNSLLHFIAFALAGLGMAEAALRVYGSAEAERVRQGVKIEEPFLTKIAHRLAPARNALGKARQAAAETEGYGLALEEAVAFALSVGG